MLHLRGVSQFKSETGRQLFRSVNSQLLLKDYAYGTSLAYPEVIPSAQKDTIGGIQLTAMQYLATLIRRFRKAVDYTSMRGKDAVALQEVLADAVELETTFKMSSKLIRPNTVVIHTDSSCLFGDTYAFFPTIPIAAAWTLFWHLRLRLIRLIVDCITILNSQFDSGRRVPAANAWVPALTECGDNVCAAIPFLIGEVDVQGDFLPQAQLHLRGGFYGCMTGMATLNSVITTPELDYARPGMRRWAFGRLLDIGNRVGLKQAHAFHRLYHTRLQANLSLRNLCLAEKLDVSPTTIGDGIASQIQSNN